MLATRPTSLDQQACSRCRTLPWGGGAPGDGTDKGVHRGTGGDMLGADGTSSADELVEDAVRRRRSTRTALSGSAGAPRPVVSIRGSAALLPRTSIRESYPPLVLPGGRAA
ncbi:hypothetical protein HBB16_13145 [Pseudonocardia sp. MCCB 268]|nr:hypothetical protein [Pseudonocardia cytotoxica]